MPLPSRRASANAGAGAPTFGGGVWWVSRQTSTVSSAATPASGERLGRELRLARGPKSSSSTTMKTGVPTVTWSNSHSASGTCMRMQPCETE